LAGGRLSPMSTGLRHDHVASTGGKQDRKVHDDEDQVVMPAGGFVAPETCVPDEDLRLDGSEHDEDQTVGAVPS
jgi:hypothetical protein